MSLSKLIKLHPRVNLILFHHYYSGQICFVVFVVESLSTNIHVPTNEAIIDHLTCASSNCENHKLTKYYYLLTPGNYLL